MLKCTELAYRSKPKPTEIGWNLHARWRGERPGQRRKSSQMIDHVSTAVSDLSASAAFYDKVLEPLGLIRIVERDKTVGFGKRYPEFWLNARPGLAAMPQDTGHHICLRASSRDAVMAFHQTALAHGGVSDGAPGDREAALTTYFGAFIRDLDGNKIEAVTFPRD